MILKINGEEIFCTKAVKDTVKHKVITYDNAILTHEFMGVEDFSFFTLTGGEWSLPDPTVEEQLQADVDYLEMENESLTEQAEQSRADVDYCMMLLGEEVS